MGTEGQPCTEGPKSPGREMHKSWVLSLFSHFTDEKTKT